MDNMDILKGFFESLNPIQLQSELEEIERDYTPYEEITNKE